MTKPYAVVGAMHAMLQPSNYKLNKRRGMLKLKKYSPNTSSKAKGEWIYFDFYGGYFETAKISLKSSILQLAEIQAVK